MGGSASYRLARKIAKAKQNGAPQSEIDELESKRQEALEAEKEKRHPKEKTFRDKINEASTREEFRNVMLEKYKPGNVQDEFLNKDIGMLKRIMNTIDDLETKYPEMAGKVHIFESRKRSGTGCVGGMGLNGNLVINENWNEYDDPALYNDGEGWHPKNTSPEAIIAHEFAHAIQAKILEKKYPNVFTNGEITPHGYYDNYEEWLKTQREWSTGSFLKPIRKEALKSLGLKVKDEDVALSQISRYAKTTIFESFAEAFADVQSNGDNASDASKAYVNALINALRS